MIDCPNRMNIGDNILSLYQGYSLKKNFNPVFFETESHKDFSKIDKYFQQQLLSCISISENSA